MDVVRLMMVMALVFVPCPKLVGDVDERAVARTEGLRNGANNGRTAAAEGMSEDGLEQQMGRRGGMVPLRW